MSVYKPWFLKSEYQARLEQTQFALKQLNLDALLAFEPETVTYLTGYFTRGYDTFQFAIVPAEGQPLIVCRDMERFYLENTAVFQDHVFWSDGDDKMAVGVSAIREMVGTQARCGIEMDSWQLTAGRFVAIQNALPDLKLVDCSTLVSAQRVIKSPAEIGYQRLAG
ncbi:MAG: aminopeptidase P family N-terminal domain-containing protein, partial [Anaerolineae bacterium]